MERRNNHLLGLAMILVLIGIAFSSCKYDYLTHKEPEEPMTVASCEGCHINYEHLLQVYSPDTAAPVGGCGGDAPHYEPYDRVFMGGDGYEAFKEQVIANIDAADEDELAARVLKTLSRLAGREIADKRDLVMLTRELAAAERVA